MDLLTKLTLILVIFTGVLVLLAIGAFAFAGWQIWLIRKQVKGEVYKKAKIKDMCFFLPDKRAYVVEAFESAQKEWDEIKLGKEIEVKQNSSAELFIKFILDAPQRLRTVTLGFAQQKEDGTEYQNHPVVSALKTTFKKIEMSCFEREIYMDWHEHWHMEFPFPRYLAKDDCFVLCFEIITHNIGKFPLDFEIITEEAKGQYTERLWLKVV